MLIKIGKVRFGIKAAITETGARQIGFTFSREMSDEIKAFASWIIIALDPIMPVYAGIWIKEDDDRANVIHEFVIQRP